MLTHHYDVIVAGLRPGALLAGALLAKGGLKVLALGAPPPAPPNQGGLSFPSHSYVPLGFEDPLLLAQALDELTIHPADRRRIRRASPSLAVVMPGHRVGVYLDDAPFEAELQREFRRPCPGAPDLMETLKTEAGRLASAWQQRRLEDPGPGLLQRLGRRIGRERALLAGGTPSFGDALADHDLSPEFATFLLAQLGAVSQQLRPQDLPLPVAAHLLLSSRAGIYGAAGLHHPIVTLLLARLKELRGEVHAGGEILAIETGWGKVKSVTLKGQSRPLACDFLIWGGGAGGLVEVLPEGLKERYLGAQRGMRADEARVSIHLGFEAASIPMGMPEQVISLRDPEGPYGEGNLLWATLSPPAPRGGAAEGVRTLTASTLVGRGGRPADPEALADLCQGMSAHLLGLMPFAEAGLVGGYRPEPEGLEGDDCAHFSAAEVLRAHPLDLGPGPRLPHWNLFHTGPGSYPLLGFEGEIAAGIQTVDCILAALR